MKVIHISSKPPFPTIDGGCVASARLMYDLCELTVELKHYTISTQKHPFSIENYPETIRARFKPENIALNTKANAIGFIKSWINGSSYNLERFNSNAWSKMVLEDFRKNPENRLIVDGLYAGVFLNELKQDEISRVFIRAHNVENEIWRGYTENCKNPLKRPLLRLLHNRLRKKEEELLSKCKIVLTISDDDTTLLTKSNIKAITIPISIPQQSENCDYEVKSLFHVGSMSWQPNLEAVKELIKLHQELLSLHPDLQLHLFGSGMEKVDIPNSKNVNIHGFVESIEDIFISSGILVSPIRSGSGIRIKLLEAMSYGVPVVSTALGASGINTEEGLFIADTSESLTDSINELINSKELRGSLGKKGKEYIRKEHEQTVVVEKLKSFLVEE